MKTKIKPLSVFFAEPDDVGSATDILNEDLPQGGGEDDVEVPEGPTPPPAPAGGFDAAKFAEQFGSSFAQNFSKVQADTQPKQQISPEEARKLLNVWEPDDAFLQEFGNMETQKGAMIKLRDGLLKQFDTLNQYRQREMRAELEKQYAPLKEYVQRAEQQAMEQDMYKAHPGLDADQLGPIRNAVIVQLQNEGKTFESKKALFAEIASRTESVVKQFNPAFTLAGAQASAPTKKTTATTAGAIPVTTPGGGGGGGTGGKGAPSGGSKPKALDFL
jgi:hypothetical protein